MSTYSRWDRWQMLFLARFFDLKKSPASDRMADFVSKKLVTFVRKANSRTFAKGQFIYEVDKIVGCLPFRQALSVVIALNERRAFLPTDDLNHIVDVANRANQILKFAQSFDKNRLRIVATTLESNAGFSADTKRGA